jgi:hypothetical protein
MERLTITPILGSGFTVTEFSGQILRALEMIETGGLEVHTHEPNISNDKDRLYKALSSLEKHCEPITAKVHGYSIAILAVRRDLVTLEGFLSETMTIPKWSLGMTWEASPCSTDKYLALLKALCKWHSENRELTWTDPRAFYKDRQIADSATSAPNFDCRPGRGRIPNNTEPEPTRVEQGEPDQTHPQQQGVNEQQWHKTKSPANSDFDIPHHFHDQSTRYPEMRSMALMPRKAAVDTTSHTSNLHNLLQTEKTAIVAFGSSETLVNDVPEKMQAEEADSGDKLREQIDHALRESHDLSYRLALFTDDVRDVRAELEQLKGCQYRPREL